MSTHAYTAEVALVGGGPSGLAAALALAAGGVETLLLAPEPPHTDRRTTALLDGSIQILRALGIWPRLEAQAAPLKFLRLIDATQRLLRAPEVLFDSAELGLDAFGYNVENETLRDACSRRAGKIREFEPSKAPLQRSNQTKMVSISLWAIGGSAFGWLWPPTGENRSAVQPLEFVLDRVRCRKRRLF